MFLSLPTEVISRSLKYDIGQGVYFYYDPQTKLHHKYNRDHVYEMSYSRDELSEEVLEKLPKNIKEIGSSSANLCRSENTDKPSPQDISNPPKQTISKMNIELMNHEQIKEAFPQVYSEVFSLGVAMERAKNDEWIKHYELGHIDKWKLRDGILSRLTYNLYMSLEIQEFYGGIDNKLNLLNKNEKTLDEEHCVLPVPKEDYYSKLEAKEFYEGVDKRLKN